MHNQGLIVHVKIPFPRRWMHMALQKVQKVQKDLAGDHWAELYAWDLSELAGMCVLLSLLAGAQPYSATWTRVLGVAGRCSRLSSKQSELFRLSARNFRLSSVLLLFYRYHKMQFWPFCPQQAIHLKYKCCPQTAVINMRQQILFFVLYCWFPPIGKLGGRRTA